MKPVPDVESHPPTAERLRSPYRTVAAEVREFLQDAAAPPIVVLAGPGGVDLAAVAGELGTAPACGPSAGRTPRPQIVHLSFSEPKPDVRLADFFFPPSRPGAVILVKNIERLHPDALPAFEAKLRQLANAGVRCVCTVALPLSPEFRSAFGEAFHRTRRDGLVRYVNLRPSSATRLGTVVTETLGARPEPALVTRLWELTRGWPGAVVTALEIFRDNATMRTIDRHAYLTGHRAPALSDNHELVLAVRRHGPAAWNVAKAVAVLSPLGEAVPVLISEALGLPEPEVVGLLERLRRAGTLRHRPAERTWQLRLPLVAAALKTLMGPYERRRLARTAITALWRGDAVAASPFHLADQLVAAGRMVDPERARRELLDFAERATEDGDRIIPWLRAAAELTADRSERAEILVRHARTCLRYGRAELALESSDTVLRSHGDDIAAGQLVPICFVHLAALHEARNLETLEKIAAGGWWPWPGTRLERTIARAFALSLLGRWRETHDLLEATRCEYDDEQAAAYIHYISPIATLWLGVADEFDRDVATLPGRVEAGEQPIGELVCHTGALLALGEPARADKLIAPATRLQVQWGAPTLVLRAIHRGEVDEALELARRHIATSSPTGCDAYQTIMFQLVVILQLFRGKLARGRELLATARSRRPTLPHALAVAEAWYETVLGETDVARSLLEAALRQAGEDGIVAHTDTLWLTLADIDHRTGRTEQLPVYLQHLEKVAAQLGTEAAEIRRLALHALVRSDRAAADAALALARRRGQPLELVSVMDRLVRFGVADPALLSEVYDLLGDLDALLCRAWLRLRMREHGITIPGRQATVVENERLLAVLMAEGLGNKQIARVLLTSEKSVEGRLSRLFSRTGFQSRVELAAAVLNGQFES